MRIYGTIMTNAEKFLSRCGMRKKGEMTEDAVKCLKKKKNQWLNFNVGVKKHSEIEVRNWKS